MFLLTAASVFVAIQLASWANGGTWDQIGQQAARQSVQEYIAEATSLRAERVRALHVVEQVDRVLAGTEPDATATYDTLAQIGDGVLHDLAGRFKLALMESALTGDIVHEAYPFEVAEILEEMRSTAMRRLKE